MELILFGSRSLFHSLMTKYKDNLEWEKGRALFVSLEYRCQATADHSLVVAFIASHLANIIVGGNHMAERMFLAGLLHDIGKVTMSNDILKSSRRLSDKERESITSHVQFGYEALETLGFSADVLHFCLAHHERIDGSGYPNGYLEESVIGRIASISDIYSALKLPRLYRPESMRDEQIIAFLNENSHQFDAGYIKELQIFLKKWRSSNKKTAKLSG